MTLSTMDQAGGSLVMTQVANERFAAYSSSKCHTCQSPHRTFIENELARGTNYSIIASQVAKMEPREGWPHPNARSIASHVKAVDPPHLISPIRVRRFMQERRAEEVGRSIMDAENLIDHVVVNDMVLQRGYERILAGEIEPTVRDTLAAVQFRQSIESTAEHGYTTEIWEGIFFAVYDTMSRELPPEYFDRVARAIDRNPLIRLLRDKAEGREQATTVVVQEGSPDSDD